MPAVLTDRELRKAGLGHLCAKPAPDPKKKTPKYNNIKTEEDGLKQRWCDVREESSS